MKPGMFILSVAGALLLAWAALCLALALRTGDALLGGMVFVFPLLWVFGLAVLGLRGRPGAPVRLARMPANPNHRQGAKDAKPESPAGSFRNPHSAISNPPNPPEKP